LLSEKVWTWTRPPVSSSPQPTFGEALVRGYRKAGLWNWRNSKSAACARRVASIVRRGKDAESEVRREIK